MANKITSEKAGEMFEVFCINESINMVVKSCGVSQSAAKRYRIEDKWDERLKKIKEKTQNKQDESIAKVRAKHLEILTKWFEKFAKKLDENDRMDLSASDYEKLVRLELLLRGDKSEQNEKVVELSPVINFISLLSEKKGDGKSFGELWREEYRKRAGSKQG